MGRMAKLNKFLQNLHIESSCFGCTYAFTKKYTEPT